MSELPRSHLVIYAVALAVIALLGARQLGRDRGGGEAGGAAPPTTIRIDAGEDGGGRAVVHVAGAVRRPGVYRLRAGARVDEAVRRAGGATRRADLTGLNLAAKVQDGRQVVVPERARSPGSGAPGAAAGSAVGAAAGGAGAAAAAPINLNTATLAQLDTLDGVGPATAQKILDFREARGGFGSVEELGEIPGIGDKRMAALREKVTV